MFNKPKARKEQKLYVVYTQDGQECFCTPCFDYVKFFCKEMNLLTKYSGEIYNYREYMPPNTIDNPFFILNLVYTFDKNKSSNAKSCIIAITHNTHAFDRGDSNFIDIAVQGYCVSNCTEKAIIKFKELVRSKDDK